MSIFVDGDTELLIQGITGREASEKLPGMLDYGTEVAAGVTPGKGGRDVEGVPVYDTVEEALEHHPGIDTSLVYVPHFAAREAVMEALEAGIDRLNVTTERIPTRDMWRIRQELERRDATLVGPTSVGVITPGEAKLGPIGGDRAAELYSSGSVGIVSKSGGMTTETAQVVQEAGFGVSTAMDIGGDRIPGTTFAEALEMFEEDHDTEAAVMFGELGGRYEQQAAEMLERGEFTKPLVAFIAGKFTEEMPTRQYGHAGAVIRQEEESPSVKEKKLREAGAHVAEVHHRIGEKLGEIL